MASAMRIALTTISLAILLLALLAANLKRDPGRIDLDWRLIRQPAHKVLAEPASRGSIVQTITAPGKIESEDEVEIASQIIGRVIAVNVKEGDSVKKDMILVELDPTDADARVQSAESRIKKLEAGIEQTMSDREKAARDARQFGNLVGRGFSAPTELADARTALAKSEASRKMSLNELDESRAMLKTFSEEQRRTKIRAPIDGVVSGLNVDVGEIVIAGTTNLPGSVLMKVSNMNKMRVRADVDETDVLLVRKGQQTSIYLQADQLHPVSGSIDAVAPQGKAKKEEVVSFETLVAIDHQASLASPVDAPRLRPGMTATVEVEVRRADDAISVPAQAVVHRRRKDLPDSPAVREWADRNARSPGEKSREAELRYIKLVFVAEGSVARARPVETGLSDEKRVEILSGLKNEDRVVVGPFRALDELKDGDPIIPVQTAAELGNPN